MSSARDYRPVERPRRLPDAIAKTLAADIQDGKFKPGEKLPTEQQLASAFAVSHSVVREAVSQLKSDGLVATRQGTGAFVLEPAQRTAFRISPECFAKRKELRQILELLGGVQAVAAAAAATNRSPTQLAAIADALARLRRPVDTEEALEARLEAEIDFYRGIAQASGNAYAVEFVEFLNRRVTTQLPSVVRKNTRAAEATAAVFAEHESMYAAIERGDAGAARTAAWAHFERAAERLSRRRDLVD